MKKIVWFASTLTLAIALLGASFAANKPVEASASGSETTMALKEKSYYEISSNGDPFYLSFGVSKNGEDYNTSLELCRFSYILKEAVFTDNEDSKVGSFVSESSTIDSFASLGGLSPWSDDAISLLSSTDTFMSFLAYRSSESAEETTFIGRKGVDTYTQTSGGSFKTGAVNKNYRFGIYFSNVKINLSFISLYQHGEDFILHYASGVTVKENSTEIAPTVNVGSNVTLYTKEGDDEIVNGSLFYEGYSYIVFQIKESDPETMVTLDTIKINNVESPDIDVKKDGVIYYFAFVLKASDTVSITSSSKTISLEKNIAIYDLADVTGEKTVSFSKLQQSGVGLGNIPNTPNTAFRFLFHTPVSGWYGEAQTKFGIYSNNASLWSTFGYILRMYRGNVSLLSGEEVLLASTDDASIKAATTLKIEIGLKKVYAENSHYFANYLYVNVNDATLASYVDEKLSALGSVITVPYIGNANGYCSFEDTRGDALATITNASAAIEGLTASYPHCFSKGEEVKIDLAPAQGYEIISFKVNDIETALIRNGGVFVATLSAPTSDLTISYLLSPNATRNLTVAASDDYTASYSTSIVYGAPADIVFTPKVGKAFSGVSVKDGSASPVENLGNLIRNGNKFTLHLGLMYEDIEVSASLVDASYSATMDSSAENYDVSFSSSTVKAGASLSFQVRAKDGYEISWVYINDELAEATNGSYLIDNVYTNIVVKAVVKQAEAAPETKAKEDNTLGFVLIGVSSFVFVALLATATILIMKTRKKEQNASH